MSKGEPPTFGEGAEWGQTVLFQSLIVQLIESRVLTVEAAQRVFDLALERAKKKERQRAPGAERLIQHVHDNLRWDEFYRWAADQQGKPPSEDRS